MQRNLDRWKTAVQRWDQLTDQYQDLVARRGRVTQEGLIIANQLIEDNATLNRLQAGSSKKQGYTSPFNP